tara:strand:+ start:3645 stop:5045 length:1401 start_codon:yes stop_codon:yes gene_type:complete
MGSSSALNILSGIIRLKVAALLLGPAGVGLIGLLQNLMSTASVAAGLGLDTAGTRQIAEKTPDMAAVGDMRRVLVFGSVLMAVLGGGIFWMLSDQFAHLFLAREMSVVNVRWLALGVAMTIVSMGQIAILNGLRRIKSLAVLKVSASIMASVLGIIALLVMGREGTILFVLSLPFSTMIIGMFLVSRLGWNNDPVPSLKHLLISWARFSCLGAKFMSGALVAIAGLLVVRSIVNRALGPDALGQFEAAWMISMTYIGFVLGAMATDYFPTLTSIITNKTEANTLVNEQTAVALYLVGPVLVLIMAFAPSAILLLYSTAFEQSAHILRLQVFGDLLKVISWPISFVILAAGYGKTYMLTEMFGVSVFAVFTWMMIPLYGIQGAGIGFIAMYAVYLPLVFMFGRCIIGYTPTRENKVRCCLLLSCLTAIYAISYFSESWCMIVGAVMTAYLAVDARRFLKQQTQEALD